MEKYIVCDDFEMPYPRTCAHRGFNTVAPENSLPAYGAAIALGAEEIEFDLWATKDGEIVSMHDSTLDRVSTGSGSVWDHTYQELLDFDFGVKKNERFKGLKILRFEQILEKFARHTIMNIHIKTRGWNTEYPIKDMEKIVSLIRKYGCERHVYFMCGNDVTLHQFKKFAPDIGVCMGGGKAPWDIVGRAIAIGAEKVQLFRPHFNKEMVDKAHANGIKCNVFWSDDEITCRQYLDMGIDTILTNDFFAIKQIVDEYKK